MNLRPLAAAIAVVLLSLPLALGGTSAHALGGEGQGSGLIHEVPMEDMVGAPTPTMIATIDSLTGEILNIEEPPMLQALIHQLGPGRSTTSVCLQSTSTPYYGFVDPGILNGSWPTGPATTPGPGPPD